ncbi:MAG TPA: hypothetical protein VJB92_01880 [Candidatus Paceibacterota bacterium]
MNQIPTAIASLATLWLMGLALAIIAGQGKAGKWYANKSKKLIQKFVKFSFGLPVRGFKWCWKKNRLATTLVLPFLAACATIVLLNFTTTLPKT